VNVSSQNFSGLTDIHLYNHLLAETKQRWDWSLPFGLVCWSEENEQGREKIRHGRVKICGGVLWPGD
jgi:hypothetical protein